MLFPFLRSFSYHNTRVNIHKRCHIFRRWIDSGEYELEHVSILAKLYKPDSYIFDVGANIGLISICLLDNCQSSKVVSFEPSPRTAGLLLRTAEQSRYANRWTVIPKAVGDRPGIAEFFTARSDLCAFDGFKDTGRAGTMERISVAVTSIDAEWKSLGNPRVSLIKIDVEGAELPVLAGATECIEHERPALFVEWNPANLAAYGCNSSRLLDWSIGMHYTIYSMPHLFKIHDEMELKVATLSSVNFLLLSESHYGQ